MITRVAHPQSTLNRAITAARLAPVLRLVTSEPSPKSPRSTKSTVAPKPRPIAAGLFGSPLNGSRVLVSRIKQAVCLHFRLPLIEMASRRQGRDVARPRQIAMYLAVQLTPMSKSEIGRRFGNRDHTTVIYAIRHIERLRSIDAEVDYDVRAIEGALS